MYKILDYRAWLNPSVSYQAGWTSADKHTQSNKMILAIGSISYTNFVGRLKKINTKIHIVPLKRTD